MEIAQMISANEVLNSSFTNTAIVYSTPVYSLVPVQLFDETKASEYLKFNAKILPNDYVAHDVLDSQELVVAYVPFMNINNYFFEKYGSFNYYHSITVVLKAIFEKEKYSLPKMHLHFQGNHFDCVILKNGELQLCNTFMYNTPEDFIYYTLFCMEQLKLDPETLPVFLYGNIDLEDEIYKIAYKYIRHIEFATTNSGFPNFDVRHAHRHFVLKNL